MAEVARLTAFLEANTTDFDRGMSKSESGLKRFAGSAKKYAVGATAALVTGGVFAVKAASDLGETVSKTNVVFGNSADEILAWSDTTADAIGTSKQQALEGASAFGLMFTQIGLGPGKAADLSKSLVTLSADLASFNNASQPEVQEALLSAYRGEYDALQKFVPAINAAKVEQEAMAETGKKNAGALSESDKALAVYQITMDQTTKAQGDFSRTSGSLANQQRILRAKLDDSAASLGTALIPAVTKMADVLSDVVGWTQEHSTATKILVAVLGGATAAVWALNIALTANPIGLVVVAIAAFTAALVVAYTKSKTFRDIVNGVFDAVKTVILTWFGVYLKIVSGFLHGLELMARGASHLPFIGDKFDGVADAIAGARNQVDLLREHVEALKPKTIHIRAVVEGLSYVTALQEHLALIHDQGVNVSVSKRASGGPVETGRPYLVGERGPELFVPRMGGTIVPNAAMAGNVYHFSFPNYVGSRDELMRVVRSGLEEHLQRGGA